MPANPRKQATETRTEFVSNRLVIPFKLRLLICDFTAQS
ncbi:hypothetical protein J3A65_002389 [Rhizobium sp. PvP014]|nr:hypothetical protein [Rhizobium sp. PvP014]MBP2529020.1 hypothetical protein [Rhizobium sp. PvP099]